jgi:alpha-tubulin suppressor-like RCC1 family protein
MLTRLVGAIALVVGVIGCSEPTGTDMDNVGPGQFVGVSAGRYHACAIDTVGRGWCWGDNTFGQSASTTETCPTCVVVPGPIVSSLRFSVISAGSMHTCGLVSDGDAYCWGDNTAGQLGTTTTDVCGGNGTCSATPVAVNGGFKFKAITAGAYGTCAITVSDVLKCWGYQGFSNIPFLTSPTTVRYPATGDSTWSHVGHTDGGSNGCGLATGGVAACWGQNFYGQLGVGSISTPRSNPIAVSLNAAVKSISSGSGFTCALTTLGEAYCWGLSVRGALAVGGDAASSPCSATAPDACFPTPLKVIGGRKYSQLAVGYEHVCGLDIETSEAYCWGSNTYFAIGSQALGPNPVAPSPFAAGNGTKYTNLAAGRLFTCGLRQDKNISCWGHNLFGQLGRPNTLVYSMYPVIVSPPTP